MLAASALTKRARAAGIVWVLVYVLAAAVASGLADGTGMPELAGLSFSAASTGLARILFEGTGSLGRGLWLLAGQLCWAALALAAVLVRLRRFVGR